jgi:hypothetical protein
VKSVKLNGNFFLSFLIPLLVFIFVIIGFLFSNHEYGSVIKELGNGLVIFLIFHQLTFLKLEAFKKYQIKVFKLFCKILFFVGVIAIIRTLILQSGGSIPFSEYLFTGSSGAFPLVTDKNFYGLYFLLAIILVFSLRKDNKTTNLFYIIANLIYLINILFCFSRRVYFTYAVFILALMIGLYVYRKKEFIRRLILQNLGLILSFFVILLILVYILRVEIYQFDKNKGVLTRYLASVNAILNPHEKEAYFKKKLWLDVEREYWKNSDSKSNPDSNLFYNGDFSNGIKFWGKLSAHSDDSMVHKLLKEKESSFLRIERFFGKGYWSLLYKGRPIYYYQNVSYTLSFKYRVVKGDGIPFNVGWWIMENGKRQHNLPLQTYRVDNGWNQCIVTYKFKDNHINPACFINSQKSNTTIDIKDVKLVSDDTLHRSPFVDQMDFYDQMNSNAFESDENNNLTTERYIRLKFATKIWRGYSIIHKLFGNGFDYLEMFGDEFYNDPQRFDYPHNPIISAFLYSGIVGGLVYFYFLILTFWFYWKYREYHMIFFVMYLITFFFCMVSGNSHFSVPLFTFLSLIPFYTKYYSWKKFEK